VKVNCRRGLLIVMAFTVGGCQGCRSGEDGVAEDAGSVIVGPEDVATASREVIEAGPMISGTLEPELESVLRAEVAGTVVKVGAKVGNTVKKGHLLARIEQPALDEELAAAQQTVRAGEIEFETARLEHERTTFLVKTGGLAPREADITGSALGASRARLEAARAKLAQVKLQLDQASVEAPIAGIVSARPVSEGDIVTLGAELFTLIDPSSMRLQAAVPSGSFDVARVGALVEFQIRGYPRQRFEGRIERVAPAADRTTRQIDVFVTIPNPTGALVAGLFGEGRIVAVTREALVVPLAAVSELGERATVARVRDGRVERVLVELGLRDERTERVEVKGPLAPGDLVLTGAARALAPNTPVELRSP
jgi:membrane fusion protein, multidrug efflux system